MELLGRVLLGLATLGLLVSLCWTLSPVLTGICILGFVLVKLSGAK